MRTNMGTLTVPRTRNNYPLQTKAKIRMSRRSRLVCGLNQWIGSADQSSVATAEGAGPWSTRLRYRDVVEMNPGT